MAFQLHCIMIMNQNQKRREEKRTKTHTRVTYSNEYEYDYTQRIESQEFVAIGMSCVCAHLASPIPEG